MNIHPNARPPRAGLRKKKSLGQGLVEFALTIPVFLMIVFGIIEGGRFMYIYASVTAAAREAARWGAASGNDFSNCAGIVDAATRIGSIAGITTSNPNVTITITYDHLKNNGVSIPAKSYNAKTTCISAADTAYFEPGATISVKIKIDHFQSIVPFFTYPSSMYIQSENTRTIVHDIEIGEISD